jgi:hypothetical protein
MEAKEKEAKSSINLSFNSDKLKEIKKVAIDEDMNTSELLETAYEFYKKMKEKNENLQSMPSRKTSLPK